MNKNSGLIDEEVDAFPIKYSIDEIVDPSDRQLLEILSYDDEYTELVDEESLLKRISSKYLSALDQAKELGIEAEFDDAVLEEFYSRSGVSTEQLNDLKRKRVELVKQIPYEEFGFYELLWAGSATAILGLTVGLSYFHYDDCLIDVVRHGGIVLVPAGILALVSGCICDSFSSKKDKEFKWAKTQLKRAPVERNRIKNLYEQGKLYDLVKQYGEIDYGSLMPSKLLTNKELDEEKND